MANDAERVRRWREHLRRRAAIGMTREAYCAWHGLSRSTMCRWEQRLRGKLARTRMQAALDAMEWIAVDPPADVLSQRAIRSSAAC